MPPPGERSPGPGWLTSNWQLKLASLLFCLALLGAVAFSQNPITFKTVQAKIDPVNLPSGITILNWSPTMPVDVSGLRDDLANAKGDTVIARMDLSKVQHQRGAPVAAETVTVVPQILASGVTARDPSSQVSLQVDSTEEVQLPVAVNIPHIANGWNLRSKAVQCGNSNISCTVDVRGPASLLNGLTAYVQLNETISGNGAGRTANIKFEQGGRPVDLTTQQTLPRITINPTTAEVSWSTTHQVESAQAVLVDSPPTGTPASGYRITSVLIKPSTVVVTGPADEIARVSTITLPPIDISGATGNITQTVRIPTPSGLETSSKVASVTYVIQPNPNVPKPPPPTSPTSTPNPTPT